MIPRCLVWSGGANDGLGAERMCQVGVESEEGERREVGDGGKYIRRGEVVYDGVGTVGAAEGEEGVVVLGARNEEKAIRRNDVLASGCAIECSGRRAKVSAAWGTRSALTSLYL